MLSIQLVQAVVSDHFLDLVAVIGIGGPAVDAAGQSVHILYAQYPLYGPLPLEFPMHGFGVEDVYHVSHTGALGWILLDTPLGVQIPVGLELWLVGVPGPHTKQGIALQGETAAAVVGLYHGHGYDDGLGYLLLAVIFKIEIVHTFAHCFYEGLLVVVVHQGFYQAKTPGTIF